METLVLTAKDKTHGHQRKFTLVRAVTRDKLLVMSGVILGSDPEELCKFQAPLTITFNLWIPEYLEIYNNGRSTVRALTQHCSERAWAIVTSMLQKSNQAKKSEPNYPRIVRYDDVINPNAPRVLPIISHNRRLLNATERKVQKLNDQYRSSENATLIMRGSPIDNVLREIYDEGKRNVDGSKLSN